MRLVMHTDLSCPFCYLGESVIDDLRGRWSFETLWVPFELHPEVPLQGVALTEARQERAAPLWRQVLGLAAALKVPFNPPSSFPNTRRALGAILAAQQTSEAAADALRRRIYRAMFVEGADIGDPDVVVALAAEVSPIGQPEVLKAVEAAARDFALDARLLELKNEGFDALVMGVPVFRPFVDGQERADRRVVGAQPAEIFEKVFEDLGVAHLGGSP